MNGQSSEQILPPVSLSKSEQEPNSPPAATETIKSTVASNTVETGTTKMAKEKSRKKNKKSAEFSEKGSVRGVETMFKGSYRTQLALTALADNKANIMISINGLILSIVIAGSGESIKNNPYLLLPTGVLLLSSLCSIFLAIRAARPNILGINKVCKEDFINGKANALFFAHFASLSADDYFSVISQIMGDKKLTYQHIVQHTHGLGIGLVKKFKLLQLAYTIFIAGLSLSILLFFIVYASIHSEFFITKVTATEQAAVTSPSSTVETKELPDFNAFKTLESVNEASGIQQLPDGRFLVINDEEDHPMDILTLDSQGQFSAEALYPQQQFKKDGAGSDFRKLADLEGIDIDKQGYIYAITSHSYNSKGNKKDSRKKLLRFKISGNTILEPVVIGNLEDSIAKQHKFLAQALADKDSKSDQGFNIEGLSLNPSQDKLLIGLRTPLPENKAVIISIDNMGDVFTHQASPKISPQVVYLNLGGDGIRSMNYMPRLKGYLIVSGPAGKSENRNFNLWFWDGEQPGVAQRVTVTGLAGFEETEGLSPIIWNGQERLLMITDGTLEGAGTARYIILKYEQLHIELKTKI
jgi:hypothetical protein